MRERTAKTKVMFLNENRSPPLILSAFLGALGVSVAQPD